MRWRKCYQRAFQQSQTDDLFLMLRAAFDESKIVRDEEGQFAEKGGGGGSGAEGARSNVTTDGLQDAIRTVREKLGNGEKLTRAGVSAELAKFKKLRKSDLAKAVASLGYKVAPKTNDEAIKKIVDRLMAATIANERSYG